MNSVSAWCFLVVGLVMQFVPALLPGSFPMSGDMGNARALWLQLMGWVQIGVAVSYFASVSWTRLQLEAARWRAMRAERAAAMPAEASARRA